MPARDKSKLNKSITETGNQVVKLSGLVNSKARAETVREAYSNTAKALRKTLSEIKKVY